jgi:integrase
MRARWRDIHMEEALWVVPPESIKAGKEHRVPLSVPASAILTQEKKATPDIKHGLHLPGREEGKVHFERRHVGRAGAYE